MQKVQKIAIDGPIKLDGQIRISGAKNAVLVELAALLLVDGVSRLCNVPNISDVHEMLELLRSCGAEVSHDVAAAIVTVDARNVHDVRFPVDILKKFRASILTAGAMLGRFGRTYLEAPGGCPIGTRPINLHKEAFEALGAVESYDGDHVVFSVVDHVRGGNCVFDLPSVGATENALLAAVCANGTTRIFNAALEPEVFDLVRLLTAMGARIAYEVPATIVVEGVDQKTLKGATFTVMPDRLEAGTWLCAAASSGGVIELSNAPLDCMAVVLQKLQRMGNEIAIGSDRSQVRIKGAGINRAVALKTMSYPCFPTDLQSPFVAALARAEGESEIVETVYQNRFLIVPELIKMGANARIDGSELRLRGVEQLRGAAVEGKDIRATAGLVVAALGAQGRTEISGVHHLSRGYENPLGKLAALGVSIAILN